MMRLPLLDSEAWDRFPDPCRALAEPNGLLAFGGDLSPQRLLAAYTLGIFPWFSEGEPILWWSPDPRCVFRTGTARINRSLRRQLAGRQGQVDVLEGDEVAVLLVDSGYFDAHDYLVA